MSSPFDPVSRLDHLKQRLSQAVKVAAHAKWITEEDEEVLLVTLDQEDFHIDAAHAEACLQQLRSRQVSSFREHPDSAVFTCLWAPSPEALDYELEQVAISIVQSEDSFPDGAEGALDFMYRLSVWCTKERPTLSQNLRATILHRLRSFTRILTRFIATMTAQ
ncbi:hypothetical protein JCM11491_003137 [Sporobolomyces phaffii]